MMYVANTDETYELSQELQDKFDNIIPLSIKIESEICLMDSVEQTEYLAMLGREMSGLDTLIQEGYKLLDLISFLTTGYKRPKLGQLGRELLPRKLGE